MPGQLYCEVLHSGADLPVFVELFRLQEAKGSPRGLDESLTFEVAQAQIDGLAAEPHETSQLLLAQLEREENAVSVFDTVLVGDLQQGLGETCVSALEKEVFNPVAESPNTEAEKLRNSERHIRIELHEL